MSSSSSSSKGGNSKGTSGVVVTPGQVIGSTDDLEPCSGCYVEPGTMVVRASLVGQVVVTATSEGTAAAAARKKNVTVVPARTREVASDAVIEVGDRVMCRVVRIGANQANVDILAVGDRPLHEFAKGVIRREDIRLAEVDKIVLHECFMPGDIVRGLVLSLGDARQYFISTAEADYGVLYAKAQATGNLLTAVSWKEMEDPVTKEKEPRKVAKP